MHDHSNVSQLGAREYLQVCNLRNNPATVTFIQPVNLNLQFTSILDSAAAQTRMASSTSHLQPTRDAGGGRAAWTDAGRLLRTSEGSIPSSTRKHVG